MIYLLKFVVAEGFLPDNVIQAGSLRDGFMAIRRKLRNLKVAATRPNIPFGTGGRKSFNKVYLIELLPVIKTN
jgi:hypothetical protein